jgi:hypothetical protein
MDYHTFRTDLGSPYDIASLTHDVFWTHFGSPHVYWVNKYVGHSSLKQARVGEYCFICELFKHKSNMAQVFFLNGVLKHPDLEILVNGLNFGMNRDLEKATY